MFSSIIILYHPEQSRLLDNIALLNDTGWSVIVIDNSPESHANWLPDYVSYTHCPENAGIAEAQNIGLREVQQRQHEYALLLDQDSLLSRSLLRGLQASIIKARKMHPKVAAIGPCIVSEFDHKPVTASIQKPKAVGEGYLSATQIIASGMVLSVHCLNEVGLKETELFIDGVDHEWCWRARQCGYEIFVDSNLHMIHKQGDARKRVLGVDFKVGQPIRLYYQFRNVLLLLPRPYVPAYWKIRNLIALPCRWIVNRFLLDARSQRGAFMWKGIKDGVKRVSGPMGKR